MVFEPSKKIKDVIARDSKVMLTTTRVGIPFIPARAEGDHVYDISGNQFIDFSSFISVYNIRVNDNAHVREAIKNQIGKLMHASFTDFYAEEPVTFAEHLLEMFPKTFGKVFFSNSGTEANEAAIKYSKIFTKRQYLMAFYGAFHGRTGGSLGLTSSMKVHREHFGPFNSTLHVPYAYCYRCPFGKEYPSCGMACVDYIKKYPLKKEVSAKEIAAIFLEPIQGEGGYIVPPKEFIKGIREITQDNGMLLVADEVQSGYMRTGKFLAMENFGVEPDIYTMAKAVGGGLPIGVTITKKSLGDVPAGAHSNTFGGNLVAMAAAEAMLKYVKANFRSLQDQAVSKGKYTQKRLKKMMAKYEIIGDVRGLGLMIGVEFVKDRKTKEPAINERDDIIKEAFVNGLVMLPAGESTIRIIPPITISVKKLEEGMDILEAAIAKVSRTKK